MKKTLRSFLMFVLPFVTGTALHAQITGTVTVPSATYPTLASVITALNTQGVGTGGAVVNITAGNNQAAPVGGYQLGSTALNASLSATKTLTINGNGNVVTAPAGTKGIVGGGDGIFWLMGTDYVTIDGLNLAESATNTDTALAMEYGYMMVNLNSTAPFDGCNRNTIKNCSVTLQRTIATPTIAIYAAHRTYASSALLTITAVGDQTSYNKFYGNTISNTATGIRLDGINDVTPFAMYDRGNDVGGTSTATGNTITNFGGTNYTSIGGITMVYQDSANVSYNIINDTANGGVPPIGGFWGIYCFGTNSNFTASNNNIVLRGASINTAYYIYGIYANAAGTNMTASNNTINVGQNSGSTSPIYGIFLPNGNNMTCSSNNITNVQGVNGVTYGIYDTYVGNVTITNNTFQYTNPVAVTGTYNGIYNAGTSVTANISNNVFNNITANTTGTVYLIYNSNNTPAVTINSNRIGTQFTRTPVSSNSFYALSNGSSPTGTTIIARNNFSNVTLNGTGTGYGINYTTNTGVTQKIVYDTISNWTMTGAGTLYGINFTYGLLTTADSNLVSGFTGGGTIYGMNIGNTSTIASETYNNTITGLNSSGASATVYGIYLSGTTTTAQSCYGNKIYNINAAGTSGTVYGIYVSSGNVTTIYNNMISGLTTPASSGTSPVYGIYLSGGNTNNLYFNTINLTPTSTGANFGATGIYYPNSTSSILDLRNNIVRVVATAAGTGTVVALRRSGGTAGTVPANLASTSNSNIYYVPAGTNAYLYDESTSTTAVNAYSITSDASFNTGCGLYKGFMAPRETSTFTEDNLTQIGTTATFAPTGSTFAESNGVSTTPAITTDFNGVTRSNPADIGALQFAGTAAGDAAPPVISYTALPLTTICTAPPSLVVNITDATGVNNTAGTAPRLYYKKSTDANAFGVANTSAGNGWKWVEVTTPTAGNYTFTFDYSKLQTAIAVGDSINYFVIAQDTRPTPNVGANIVGFPAGFCPTSVNLPVAAGPLTATPRPNGYKILAPGTYTATASNKSICVSGATTLTLTPLPVGATIQWQQDNNTATYTDIAGANTASYALPTVTASSRYRAQIKCGTTVIATSTSDTVVVTSPQVLSTTPASRCGIGTVVLGATGANLKWYDQATGGTSVGSGSSFTTPSITSTTTYYVTAGTAGGSENLPSPTAGTATFITTTAGWGLRFTANATATINSVNIKAINTSAATANIQIKVTDLADVVLYTGTAYSFPITTSLAVYTIPVNITVPPGNYKMVMTYSNISDMVRESGGVTFPYTATSNAISITAGANGAGTAQTTSAYYWFYNWVISAGCESNRVPVIATVGAAPPITANANPSSICPGGSSTVSVTSPNAGYSYSWSNGQTVASFSVTPATTTKYVVTATDAVTSCANKDSVTVTVINQTASITPSATQTICTGNSVTLTANSGTGLSYEWFNGTTSTGVTTATYSATTAGSYTVKVTHTASGCFAISTPVVVNVVAPPISTITPGGNLTLCSGGTLTLNGPTGTGYTYQWKLGSSNASGTSTGVSYNATLAGTYTLVVSANGCSTTSAPSTITILPLPLATMSPSAPATACDSVVLSSSNTNVTYQWNYNTQPILGANAATYGAPVTGNYSLTTTSTINGCSATSAPVAITINQSPAATITYSSPITFCAGGAVVLNTYSGANLVYEWRDGTVPIPGATTNTYTTSTSGNYSVRVLNSANNCARVSQVVNVKVNPLPTPAITYNSGTNTLTTTLPYAQYQWVLNSQHIGGATQRNYIPQQSGAYLVIVTDTNGCMSQSEIQFVNNVGVVTTNVGKAITIYPNPTTDMLYVKSPADVNVSLRDITGKTVLSGTDKTSLNLANLADGMYMLFVTDKSGQLIRAEKITKSTN